MSLDWRRFLPRILLFQYGVDLFIEVVFPKLDILVDFLDDVGWISVGVLGFDALIFLLFFFLEFVVDEES